MDDSEPVDVSAMAFLCDEKTELRALSRKHRGSESGVVKRLYDATMRISNDCVQRLIDTLREMLHVSRVGLNLLRI